MRPLLFRGCFESFRTGREPGKIACRTSMGSDANLQRKCFWLLLTLLSLGAIFLPLGWGVVETLVSVVVSWWVAYRSGIF